MTPHTASLLQEEPWMRKPICVAGPLEASVGQSIHTPFQISSESLQFKLPLSDYPQDSGSVSPGVILLVNNMKEVPYNGTDKFMREDVTVTVTCQPKKLYPSSATNWFNDLYSVRYLFPEEHELELDTDPASDHQDPSKDRPSRP